MSTKIPWSERVSMLSRHPDAASRDDIARLASELMKVRNHLLWIIYYADPPHPTAKMLIKEAQDYLDEYPSGPECDEVEK